MDIYPSILKGREEHDPILIAADSGNLDILKLFLENETYLSIKNCDSLKVLLTPC